MSTCVPCKCDPIVWNGFVLSTILTKINLNYSEDAERKQTQVHQLKHDFHAISL